MVHWVYILRCDGEIEEWTSKGMNDKIYVGETLRLYRRLKEHVDSDRKGSCTTSEFYPNRLIGLYKVEDDLLYIDHENDIYKKMYEEGYLDKLENKTDALNLENTITEMYMQSMGPKWENVYGGKYHNGYRPIDNPSVSVKFNRPYCNCKIPADIKERNGKIFWRCSVKNIGDGLQKYIKDELGLNLQRKVEPCKYYKEYTKHEEFKCEKLIYNNKLTSQKFEDNDLNYLINKSHWLGNMTEEATCHGECDRYCYLKSGQTIGWEVPPKSKFYTRPIKYKNKYISLCYDCFKIKNKIKDYSHAFWCNNCIDDQCDKCKEYVTNISKNEDDENLTGNTIVNKIKLSGKCLILSDSDDE